MRVWQGFPARLVQVSVPEQFSTSRVTRLPRRGFSQLRFQDFVEEQFRQYYADLKYATVRPLLVVAAAAVIGITFAGLYKHSISATTAAFGLAIMLPLLMATLFASYRAQHQRLYETLLALSVLCVGLIVDSITLRASLNGTPYYFGGQIAWIFIVWLVLGLTFWYAAGAAVTISLAYGLALFHWKFGAQQVMFESLMLIGANMIGALCCFQHEARTRADFSKNRLIEDQAHRDGLTGLHNRRVYDRYLERIWRLSQRDETQITIMMIDIDCFKSYNDLYGHQAGDDALRKVAGVIESGAQRPLDFAARYGGEEFALVLYGPLGEAGRGLPEQIRQKVEALALPHARSTTSDRITVSIGVAIITPGAERSLAGAVQMADEALYQAKEEGRNRVVVKESRLTHIQTGRFRASRRAAASS